MRTRKEKKQLEEEVDELNRELDKAEDLSESWRNSYFILVNNRGVNKAEGQR